MSPLKLTALITAILGGVLLIIGLVLGFTPISGQRGVTCGSAFAPDKSAAEHQYITDQYLQVDDPDPSFGCDQARSSRKAISLALVIPGGVLVVTSAVCLFVAAGKRETTTE